MKIFKVLFKFIFSIVFLLLVMVFLLYKNVNVPTYTEETLNINEMIDEEFNLLFTGDNDDFEFKLSVSDNLINNYILETVEESLNTKFNKGYVYEEGFIRVQGVWSKIEGDNLDIYFGAHLVYKKLVYKTSARIRLKIIETNLGVITFKLEKFNLGKLSFKWLVRIAPTIANIFMGDFSEFLQEELGGLVSYNQRNMTVSVNLNNMVDSLDDEALMFAKLLINNNLLELKIKDKISLSLNLNKLKDDFKVDEIDESDKLSSMDDLEKLISNKLISGALSNTNHIKFSELDVKKIFSFMITNEISENEYLFKGEVYEDINLTINNPSFYMDNNNFYILFETLIGKEEKALKTNIKAKVTFNKQASNLVLTLKDVSLGEVLLERDVLMSLLSGVSNEFLTDGKIIIEDFFKDFDDDNLRVNKIKVEDGYLVLEYKFKNNLSILDEIINIPINEELKSQIIDLANGFLNGEINEDNYLEHIDDILDKLTEEDLDLILGMLEGYLDGGFGFD